ncbi:hypothetical protein QJS04_geneDACA006442 [Acorus gramineus]|uniref:CYTH domain-containing protein n=1 Tax=Acorus gramineus TaxID=55184 RepID=A0AAV9AVU0_ACOGR|nr:hypothetical protein QJS04_geneDACA006442 [Acorus gramineus]
MEEVEVKLRLPDAAAHQALSDVLSPYHLRTHLQENVFFDGAAAELSSNAAVLRLRFYGPDDSRCVASIKARAVISGGIGRAEEDEEELDPLLARPCVAEPGRLAALAAASRVVRRAVEEFGVGEGGFVCLGGFRNVRAVYGWVEAGLTLEVDETRFEFGTAYEVECETAEPERARELLEGLLRENGIPYAYNEASKFAVFRAGKLN